VSTVDKVDAQTRFWSIARTVKGLDMDSELGPALSAESLTEKVFVWLTEA
jgi:hypothetical protein